MKNHKDLVGVITAAVTPLAKDFSLMLDDILPLLDFFANNGSHGALLFGTTGEGPSFSQAERLEFLKVASDIRGSHPDFILLAGTGTPSLDDTLWLTRVAFDLNYDGVVVLPPYYYRGVTEKGLFDWYSYVIHRSVPRGGVFLGYHIPHITGVPLTIELIHRLKDAYPEKFAGIKDSSGDVEFARNLGEKFGKDLLVYTGHDALLSHALSHSASGCITAMANIMSPDLRNVWDGFVSGREVEGIQNRLTQMRGIMGRYAPFPPLYKALLARLHGFNDWEVRPPLISLTDQKVDSILSEIEDAIIGFSLQPV